MTGAATGSGDLFERLLCLAQVPVGLLGVAGCVERLGQAHEVPRGGDVPALGLAGERWSSPPIGGGAATVIGATAGDAAIGGARAAATATGAGVGIGGGVAAAAVGAPAALFI